MTTDSLPQRVPLSTLRAIQDRDPDGFPQQPTDAAHAAHQAWAIEVHGQDAWNAYTLGGWEPEPDW